MLVHARVAILAGLGIVLFASAVPSPAWGQAPTAAFTADVTADQSEDVS